ncbi:MAG TPA: AI-2E family transporter [Miltoncostaeaceae bacterium]|nr:AI-2E family transporter [Miltoncostaeaceae bacterium]
MSGRSARIPSWAQLFLIPAALVTLWILGTYIGRALFIFLTSSVIALLLNPVVRMLRRAHIPRGLAVLMVYLGFVIVLGGAALAIYGPAKSQVEDIRTNLPQYSDEAQQHVDDLQRWFDRRGIDINVQQRLNSAINSLRDKGQEIAGNFIGYSLDIIGKLVTFIIIIVASIYMLLDARRITMFAQKVFGPEAGTFLRGVERNLASYLRAQVLVCLIIGVSAGVILWIYGETGVFPQGSTYAIAFGLWVFVAEFIPYVGPILGAIPPTLLALFTSPITALWVIIAFIGIHQLEGHIVVPKVMGGALGVHPLVVIFGLVIGEELYGLAGILLAIPVVVIGKEFVNFLSQRYGIPLLDAKPPPIPPPIDTAPTAEHEPVPPPAEAEPTRELPTRVIEPASPDPRP